MRCESRHRDHFTSMAAVLNSPAGPGLPRASPTGSTTKSTTCGRPSAGAWKQATRRRHCDWRRRCFPSGRTAAGTAKAWHGWRRLLGRKAGLHRSIPRCMLARSWTGSCWSRGPFGQRASTSPHRALALAREVGDPALVIRGLIARGVSTYYDEELAGPCFAEAAELAQGLDDPWIWSQIYVEQARSALGAGDPVAVEDAAVKGLEVSTAIGNHATTRVCPLGPRMGTRMARRTITLPWIKLDTRCRRSSRRARHDVAAVRAVGAGVHASLSG